MSISLGWMSALWIWILVGGAFCTSIDLGSDSGINWSLVNSNNSISVAALVPGGVYSDLTRAGVINDSLLDYNDVTNRWIAYDSWSYTASFFLTEEQLKIRAAQLVFHGLDTIAFVNLNDHPVLVAENMFALHTVPVKGRLQVGNNTLNVTFASPVQVAEARSIRKFVAPRCVPSEYHGECHANQLRKMQASFGWDWGPALPSSGIWKKVELNLIDVAVIRYITTRLTDLGKEWELSLDVHLETGTYQSSSVDGYLIASIVVDSKANLTLGRKVMEETDRDGKLNVSVKFTLSKNKVSLWWPNGYGEQKLYPVQVQLLDRRYDAVSQKEIHVGFRTIELVQEKALNYILDAEGRAFCFSVNGQHIFMKGTNYIPANILPELSYNKAVVDNLLEAAVEAHMNMIRVWGGGVYESDYLYSKCDQLGLLVWQDMMFACSMYPADHEFLRLVEKEIKHNVLRLQHRPSIALWAGNNENEAALRSNWYGTSENFDRYREEYLRLYVDTMKPLVESLDPTRQFVVSSPSNGIQSEDEDYIAKNPYDPRYGDTHYYNYVFDGWQMSTYPNTRFASEYGFQSLPSMETWRSATTDGRNLKWGSDFFKHRQHSTGGNENMQISIERHMILPAVDEDGDEKYLKKFIFYSQISQAMSIKAETEFYRQSKADWYTMGALYWQLNDVWQAPSWSSIDYGGRWKLLHYFAKKFFAPILVSPRVHPSGDIDVYLINDKLVPLYGVVISVEWMKYDSLAPFQTKYAMINVKPLETVKTILTIEGSEIRNNATFFLRFNLKDSQGIKLSPYNYVFPASFKHVDSIKKPNISIEAAKIKSLKFKPRWNRFKFTITTDTVILFLWLETGKISGHFSENGLIVTKDTINVIFSTEEEVDVSTLKNSVSCSYYYHSPEQTVPIESSFSYEKSQKELK